MQMDGPIIMYISRWMGHIIVYVSEWMGHIIKYVSGWMDHIIIYSKYADGWVILSCM